MTSSSNTKQKRSDSTQREASYLRAEWFEPRSLVLRVKREEVQKWFVAFKNDGVYYVELVLELKYRSEKRNCLIESCFSLLRLDIPSSRREQQVFLFSIMADLDLSRVSFNR